MSDTPKHDHGLQRDLQELASRRKVLKFGAAAGAAGLVAGSSVLPGFSSAYAAIACKVHTSETAGPFPADGSNTAHGTLSNVLADSGIVRTDMRFDLGKTTDPAPGVELDLTVTVVDVKKGCAPLAGYAVYLWQCDADGAYSIYMLPNRTYLRGVGVSDDNGVISIKTIVPGCYPGRFPHFHFEVYPSLEKATDYRNRVLTSQLAIPPETCEDVYSNNAEYAKSVDAFRFSPLARDFVFARQSPDQLAAQMLVMKKSANGMTGTVTIGLDV